MTMKIIDIIAKSNVVTAHVELPYSADVYIVDQKNLNLMQQGDAFDYVGGSYNETYINLSAATNPGQRMYLIVDNSNSISFNFSYTFSG